MVMAGIKFSLGLPTAHRAHFTDRRRGFIRGRGLAGREARMATDTVPITDMDGAADIANIVATRTRTITGIETGGHDHWHDGDHQRDQESEH